MTFLARASARQFSNEPSMGAQYFFLISYDRLLIPQDPDLVANHHSQLSLIAQDFALISQNDSVICD